MKIKFYFASSYNNGLSISIFTDEYKLGFSIEQNSFNQLTDEEKRAILKYILTSSSINHNGYRALESDGMRCSFESAIIKVLGKYNFEENPSIEIEISKEELESKTKTCEFTNVLNGKQQKVVLRKIEDIIELSINGIFIYSIVIPSFIELDYLSQLKTIQVLLSYSIISKTGCMNDEAYGMVQNIIHNIYGLIDSFDDNKIYTFYTSRGVKSIIIRKIGSMIVISENPDEVDWLTGIKDFKTLSKSITSEEMVDNILKSLYPIYGILVDDAKNIISLINEII